MQLNNQQNQIQFTPEAKKTYYRLQQIEKELQNIASYGSACDELLNLMSDNCVYNAYCEIAFLKCLLIVGEKARYFGVWSGSQILKKARENCAVLSSEVQAAIIELYTELNSSVRKEKPTSGTSSSFTQPQPLTATTPVATTPVATTPVATTPVATTPVATTPVATTPSASTQTQTNYNNSTEVAISDMDSVLYNTSFPETPTALHSNSPGHSSIASPATQPENSAFILSDRNLINLHNQQNATHQSPSPRTQATFTNPVPFVPTPISQSFATIYPSHYPHPSWTQYNPNIQQQQLQHQIPANNQVIYAIPPSPTQLQYNPHQTSGQHIYRQQHQQQQRSHDFAPIFNTNPGQINSQKLASTMASSTHLSSTSKANQQNTTQYMQSAQFQYPANQSPMRQRAPQQESQNITQQQHHERFMRMKQQQLLQQHLQHHLYQQQQQQQQQQQYHHQIATSSPIYNIYQQQPQSITPNTNFQAQGLNSANIQQSINEQLLNDFSYIFAATESNGTSADNTAPKVPRSSSESLPATPPAQKQRFVTPCLPSIPQPSHDQSLLPTKMTAIGDPKDEVDTKDLALFPKLILNLVEPFHLIHGQKITDKYFSIATNQYNNLYSERNKVVQPNRGLPLVIILTAWQVKAEKKMCWPDHIRISVNNHMLQLEKKRSIEGRSATYIGKDKPYDLKNVLKDGKNHIRLFQDNCACVSSKKHCIETYRFCVRLYVRESEHYILERVKQKELPVKMGKDMIDILLGKKPGNDNDDEIAIKQSSVKVNLKCPFSFRRMKTPVKGLRCKHVACFDLHNYLTSNKTEYPNWICPHCNEICTSDNLAHDLFFGELLKVLPKNVAEIEFKDDHSNIRITKEDDDDDDDDSIKYNDDEEDEIKNDYNRKEGKIQKVENNIEVVDLISDEEEDDNNTAKRQKLM